MTEVVVTTAAIRRAKLQSNHHRQQTNTQLFTGRMTFLSSNEQCQSTEERRRARWMNIEKITAADWFASRFHFHRASMRILNIVDSASSPSPGTESSAPKGDSWMPQTYTACRCTLCRPVDHPVSSQHPSMMHSPTFSFSLSLKNSFNASTFLLFWLCFGSMTGMTSRL